MKTIKLKVFFLFTLLALSFSCKKNIVKDTNNIGKLILKRDSITSLYAYFDEKGNKILGDYYDACTDTITDYGIVADLSYVLIDKSGKHIYDIFNIDNGPDYTSEGIYRIVKNGRIGYVDSISSKVLIEPKFDCAYPFKNGKAKVSVNGKKVYDGEHYTWESNDWYYIDKKGNIVK
jgi:hypothetical protein